MPPPPWPEPGPHTVLANALRTQGVPYPNASAKLLLDALHTAGYTVKENNS
ncbi:hypothetical protein [Mycobacterium sp. 1245801.1]|uniref:hypothetical protein n=1 Tax=Mycobacterium sp. 1245801.1 TaxID=1834075 RepID=UPI000B32410B|nr:hypothetical protein [Mycobacterium sp. 1245801.1]